MAYSVMMACIAIMGHATTIVLGAAARSFAGTVAITAVIIAACAVAGTWTPRRSSAPISIAATRPDVASEEMTVDARGPTTDLPRSEGGAA